MQFQGAFTALVTPFRNGAVDEERYRALIEWQIEQGINGLVPCGTTGESATLTHQEHKDVIRICVEQVKGRVPVLAGAGSNNTREAVELTRYARQAGADGALLITPYYNKPTQEGLYQHFKAIAAEVPMPFIVYNVPSRTGTNLCPETLARMKRDIPEVIGVKEATGNLIQGRGRLRGHLGEFQRGARQDVRVVPRLLRGRPGHSAPGALRNRVHQPGHVLGDQPHPGQDGPVHDGQNRAGTAPAHGAVAARQPVAPARHPVGGGHRLAARQGPQPVRPDIRPDIGPGIRSASSPRNITGDAARRPPPVFPSAPRTSRPARGA